MSLSADRQELWDVLVLAVAQTRGVDLTVGSSAVMEADICLVVTEVMKEWLRALGVMLPGALLTVCQDLVLQGTGGDVRLAVGSLTLWHSGGVAETEGEEEPHPEKETAPAVWRCDEEDFSVRMGGKEQTMSYVAVRELGVYEHPVWGIDLLWLWVDVLWYVDRVRVVGSEQAVSDLAFRRKAFVGWQRARWVRFVDFWTGVGMRGKVARDVLGVQYRMSGAAHESVLDLLLGMPALHGDRSIVDVAPGVWLIDWWGSCLLWLQKLRFSLSAALAKNMPADAFERFVGVNSGGDNRDMRARLLYSNWLAIRRGLSAGQLVPICHLVLESNKPKQSIFSLLASDALTVLYFVGRYPNHDEGVDSAFGDLCERVGDHAQCFLVTNQYDISKYDADANVLGDVDALVHEQWGVPLGMVYVVRTDGYVVGRGLIDMVEKILFFLK